MKKFSILRSVTMALIAMIVVGIAACEKEEPVGVIPNAKEIICSAGDRPTFTFSVTDNWQLSSDATWCKFITSAGEVLDMSGRAGTHTITLRITDENIKNEPTFANITMKMSGKKGIIATVERGANQLYMRIYDITDTPISAIELGYVDWVPFRVEANFRFAAVDYPEWVEFYDGAVTGVPGEQTEAMARIVCDGEREQYPINKDDGYTITFADESGKASFTFPIVFKGMGNTDLSFVGPTANTYGWEVSLDGKSFRQKDEATGEYITKEEGLTYHITALKNDYEVLLFEKVVDRGIPSYELDAKWMEFDYESATLSVKATDKTRYGMAMALPRGIYNKIRADIKGNIFELDDASGLQLETVKYEYLQYIIAELTQMDFAERDPYDGMYVYHSLTIYEIPCTPYSNAEVLAAYGVEDAYTCPFPLPKDGKTPSIIIDPRIEGWTTDSFTEGRATVEFYYRGEKLKVSDGEFEVGENKDEVMAARLIGPKAGFEDNVEAIFKLDGVAKKLLVVTPPTE